MRTTYAAAIESPGFDVRQLKDLRITSNGRITRTVELKISGFVTQVDVVPDPRTQRLRESSTTLFTPELIASLPDDPEELEPREYSSPACSMHEFESPEVTIYHNPACSKSRETLALIRGSGISPRVIETGTFQKGRKITRSSDAVKTGVRVFSARPTITLMSIAGTGSDSTDDHPHR